MYQDMVNRVQQLDKELKLMLQYRYHGPEFQMKERELRNLQRELEQIHQQKQQPPHPNHFSTYSPFFPTPSITTPPTSFF
jgi:hypothetical protein